LAGSSEPLASPFVGLSNVTANNRLPSVATSVWGTPWPVGSPASIMTLANPYRVLSTAAMDATALRTAFETCIETLLERELNPNHSGLK
jgi:hypothetical protein